MWYPFKGWVTDYRRISESMRLHRLAKDAPGHTRKIELLEEALRFWPGSHWVLHDLAVASVRCGRLREAAGYWRESIKAEPRRRLTEAEYVPLMPVFPAVAREALDELSTRGYRRDWQLENECYQEPFQRWSVMEGKLQSMAEMRPILNYVALLIAQVSKGPGQVMFLCLYYPRSQEGTELTSSLGEAVWEWNVSREVRCTSEKQDPDVGLIVLVSAEHAVLILIRV